MTLKIEISLMPAKKKPVLGRKSHLVGGEAYEKQSNHHIHVSFEHVSKCKDDIEGGISN